MFPNKRLKDGNDGIFGNNKIFLLVSMQLQIQKRLFSNSFVLKAADLSLLIGLRFKHHPEHVKYVNLIVNRHWKAYSLRLPAFVTLFGLSVSEVFLQFPFL